MNNSRRLLAFFFVFSILTGLFVLPVSAAAAVPYEALSEVSAECDNEKYEEYSEQFDAKYSADVTSGELSAPKKIGAWLDRTFYSLDRGVYNFFGKIQSQGLTAFVNVWTQFGDTLCAIGMLFVGAVLCLFKKTRKYGLTLCFAIVLGTLFTNVVLKNVCGRARPYITLAGDREYFRWWLAGGANVESDNSFPSGHTTCIFEMMTALFLVFNGKKQKIIRWIFPVIALSIMASRLYLMVHYFTDVCAGMVVGITAGVIAYFIAKKLNEIPFISEFDLRKKSR